MEDGHSDWRAEHRKPEQYRKTCRISLRLTQEEHDLIRERAEAANLNISDFCIMKAAGIRKRKDLA